MPLGAAAGMLGNCFANQQYLDRDPFEAQRLARSQSQATAYQLYVLGLSERRSAMNEGYTAICKDKTIRAELQEETDEWLEGV